MHPTGPPVNHATAASGTPDSSVPEDTDDDAMEDDPAHSEPTGTGLTDASNSRSPPNDDRTHSQEKLNPDVDMPAKPIGSQRTTTQKGNKNSAEQGPIAGSSRANQENPHATGLAHDSSQFSTAPSPSLVTFPSSQKPLTASHHRSITFPEAVHSAPVSKVDMSKAHK
ncbi:hypothetical protein IWQ62_006897, partial [Dispira parvispora]